MEAKIKTIEIKARAFFELLKTKDKSMWTVFAEMMDEHQEQLIIFVDDEGKEMAHYILPTNLTQLQQDQKQFANSFKQKINAAVN